jgi:hypothetical protein
VFSKDFSATFESARDSRRLATNSVWISAIRREFFQLRQNDQSFQCSGCGAVFARLHTVAESAAPMLNARRQSLNPDA